MYKVYIKIPNKIFVIKNKIVRTPLTATVSKRQLDNIMAKIKLEGINESQYEIEELSEDEIHKVPEIKKKNIADKLSRVDGEVQVEELEPSSTLERILRESGDE